jgi:hypothetical protein
MVVADSSGVLSTQAIPSGGAGTVTSIATTGPITGGTITSSGTIGITQATTSTDGYLSSTDWNTFNNKQAALGFTPVTNARTITINGTTFDLTADRSFSVGTVTGSGSTGYVPKWSSGTALGNSLIYDAGTSVLIGTQTAGSGKFMVYSTTADNHYQAVGTAPSFRFADAITNPTYTGIIGMATASNNFIIGAAAGDMILSNNTNSAGNFLFGTGATERMRINATTGNISINNTNNTFRLDVTGTVRFTGQLTLGSTITNGTHTYTLPSATGTLALTSDITVTSVNGLTGAVTLTTSNIAEGTNLYYTEARVNANANVAANTAARHSAVTLSTANGLSLNGQVLSLGLANGSANGALSSTDWTTFNNKQSALNGTGFVVMSGTTVSYDTNYYAIGLASNIASNAELNDFIRRNGMYRIDPGVTAAPSDSYWSMINYGNQNNVIGQLASHFSSGETFIRAYNSSWSAWRKLWDSVNLTNPVTGTGTTNYLPKFTGASTITDSQIFDNGSFVGINTASPNTPLSIVRNHVSGQSILKLQPTTSYASGGLSSIGFNDSDGSRKALVYNDSAGLQLETNVALPILFNPNGNVRMTLNASGNLSIGNTNDTYKLDVTGNIRSSETVLVGNGAAQTELRINSLGGTNQGPFMRFQKAGSNKGYIGTYSAIISGTSDDLTYYATGSQQWMTNNSTTTKMLLDASGNLGLGVTPSAWQSGTKALQINGGSMYAANTFTFIGSNAVYTDAGDKYINTGFATIYGQLSGEHRWYNAPSGTAGNAISFTQAMTLNASGNLSIGNTNDSFKLDVTGTGRFSSNVNGGYLGIIIKNNSSGTNAAQLSLQTLTQDWLVNTRTDNHFSIYNNTAGTTPFLLDKTTGAATFSDEVRAGSWVATANSRGFTIRNAANTAYRTAVQMNSSNVLIFGQDTDISALTLGVGSEQMRITSGGNVGIGTTTINNRLEVDGNINVQSTQFFRYNGDTGLIGSGSGITGGASTQLGIRAASDILFATNGATERMRITSAGDVLVNATATTQGAKFYVNGLGAFGSVYVGSLGTGTVYSNAGTLTNTNPSDFRLKNTIKPLTYGLNEVLQLNPKTFYYNDDLTKARLKYGFIAQEVKDVMPDLVRRLGADTDYLGLENEGIFVTLVNAIKEQQVQLNEQRSIINELKSQLNK